MFFPHTPSGFTVAGSSRIGRGVFGENDDRLAAWEAEGLRRMANPEGSFRQLAAWKAPELAVIADAQGSAYGGYHAPLGADVILPALAGALGDGRHAQHACTSECLTEALVAANGAAFELAAAHNEEHKRELRRDGDRLGAAARAARTIAKRHLGRDLSSHAHFGASIGALLLHENAVVAAVVGACRIYRMRRGGALELCVPEQTLGTVHTATAPKEMRALPAQVLGLTDVVHADVRAFDVTAGDRFLACTDGIWAHVASDAIAIALGGTDAVADVERLLKAADGQDDATAVLVERASD